MSFIQLTLKQKDENGGNCKFIVAADEISGVIDAKDGVVITLKSGGQAVVDDSFQTVKNRIVKLTEVI